MLKIGDFSKICRVPVTALRYYADHGLLTPVHIDPATGYRYYVLDQLPRLNRILALRDLGLSLASIRRLLDENVTSSELQGMLRLREAELEQEVQAVEVRLQQVRERLRQIEHEANPVQPEVVIRAVEAQTVLSVRTRVPDGEHVALVLGDMVGVLYAHTITPTAAPMTIFHDSEFKDANLDIEIACPVALPLGSSYHSAAHRPLTVRRLDAISAAACTLHVGDYALFPNTYAALGRWIEQSGCQIVGQPHEVYLRPPAEDEPALTEIYIPVEQKGV